ncbi:mandelate racemase/muconate lactonizing enzyme family protein [Trebonia kvetii]|uniref:Mandelate racemase/muconate lactonizing enzyme family protein n=1 Tax=Trebonia kvetii TaxID=2480626 RepID=A0A6P2C0K1_9ACTN|nr:mandelate racemase/muconate lactonizing enzyme family protein [Trebonia kvetii]
MTIASIEALPVSFPLRQAVTQGLGSVTKRDTVIVKVTTVGGLTGYGESYNGRAPLAVAATVNTTLRDLLTGMDAAATTAVWDVFERRVLANHGTCAACVCAMSGIDMALWDLAGKALGVPLYRLLGGSAREVPAYAGGFALGYAAPAAVADEALSQVAAGYRAVKLRLGDTLESDAERARALRAALGSDVGLLADANCRYSVSDVRAMLPVLAETGAGWLEEPFPPYQDRSWRSAGSITADVLPLAAGENCYTRYEFHRLLDAGAVSIVQPDLSRCGGITEALRIAALASGAGLPVCTHGCHTGLNFAASVHFLAAIENGWYFEADGSTDNPLRTVACSASYRLSASGTVTPLDGPGLGVEVDEDYLRAHPLTDGPAWH